MFCVYVQVVSAVLCEFLNFSYLKMYREEKSFGESLNSYRRERYRKSDKSFQTQNKGGGRRYRSRTQSSEGRERVWNTGMSSFDLDFQESGVFLNE